MTNNLYLYVESLWYNTEKVANPRAPCLTMFVIVLHTSGIGTKLVVHYPGVPQDACMSWTALLQFCSLPRLPATATSSVFSAALSSTARLPSY